MDANAWTPRDLFDGTVFYEVPPFQRPYVWTEEDQWQPLWDDIERLAEDPNDSDFVGTHFLGAVVLKHVNSVAGEPARSSVIDGQQRLTTLQLLLDAAQEVVEANGDEEDAETLQELVTNQARRFRSSPRRFKLWPSRVDRPAFEHVMDNDLTVPTELADTRIGAAHRFFRAAIEEWATSPGGDPAARLHLLTQILQHRLQIVAIDLGEDDDDQLIFETLNDRGTPLLAADLIKNYVFQHAEHLGADVDAWSETYWADFDRDWWRELVSQGRLFRSRIDLFLQYWLTMRLRAEVPADAVFSRFRGYANEHLTSTESAEALLRALRADADTFRDLTELDPTSAAGSFYFRVVESLELGAFIPLLLWTISENHNPPRAEADKALAAVESWAVRRTLLRRTMKDVNKLMVALLKDLDAHPLEEVGERTIAFLASQTADARSWPTDDEVLSELPSIKMYGNIRQSRLRTVLSAVELRRRSERHENVTLPDRLEIEHVMPRGWRDHWDSDGASADPERAARRDRLIHTLGNLTLVTQKLNGALSNRPWLDADAAVVAPSGSEAGVGKRSLIGRFSVLVINKDIVDPHPQQWTEDNIVARSNELARDVIEVWTRPRA